MAIKQVNDLQDGQLDNIYVAANTIFFLGTSCNEIGLTILGVKLQKLADTIQHNVRFIRGDKV